ncbi:MAG: prepilin-type N-terminal cleavage/methylation domain-containing protein [Pseudomonadota bacterium]
MSKQLGYSLIELSMTIIVMGMLIGIATHYYQYRSQKVEQHYDASIFPSIHNAIEGFIYANYRLPCPAADESGTENCNLSQGFVPYQTLALAYEPRNSAGVLLSYAVYSNPNLSLDLDADLMLLTDRNRPFIAKGSPPVGQPVVLGNANEFDFCQALLTAKQSSVDNNVLNISNDPALGMENVAYIIADPGAKDADGDGNSLDGINAQAGINYHLPSMKASLNYDDYVDVMYFDNLWEQLSCVSMDATSGHASANLVSAANIKLQTMLDYKIQLQLIRDMAAADIASAAAATTGSVAAIATAATTMPIGIAQAILTVGAAAPSVALSTAAIVAAGVTTAAAVAATALAVAAKVIADDLYSQADGFVNDITYLQCKINEHMKEGDQMSAIIPSLCIPTPAASP